MKSLAWLLLLGFIVAACRSDDRLHAVLDLSKGPKKFDAAPARDPIVKVTGPSVVYVEQNKQPRVVIIAKRAGEVIAPIRAVDDGSGPLTVRVEKTSTAWPGLKKPYEEPDCDCICTECLDVANACCMLTHDGSSPD